MKSFSERFGYKNPKTSIQINSMDDDLRNGLWNALTIYFWDDVSFVRYQSSRKKIISESDNKEIYWLAFYIWKDFFKWRIDEMSNHWGDVYVEIRQHFLECEWQEVYEFLEFVVNNYTGELENYYHTKAKFTSYCNQVLEKNISAYRFVERKFARITSGEEISEIESAIDMKDVFKPVSIHIKAALDMLSDRKKPDYRNSIKESISAVEAMCRIITGDEKATLGAAIKKLKEKIEIHGAFEKAFSELYGFTSDEGGIRHSLMNKSKIGFEDANFMLVSCSAFVNYLKVKHNS